MKNTKPICLFKVRHDAFCTIDETPPFEAILEAAYPMPELESTTLHRDPNSPWSQLTDNYIVFSVPAAESQQEPIVIEVLNVQDSDMANFEELKNQVLESLLKK